MNDASFCSDAHRQAFGEEQMLAMQRLTDTPPLQRTQRMPVATLPPPISPYGPTMSFQGERCQDPPRPVEGPRICISAIPIMVGATVLFRDRDHKFQLETPRSARPLPLAFTTGAPARPKAAMLGQSSTLRVAFPRALSTSGRFRPSLKPYSQLRQLSPPVPATAARRQDDHGQTALPVDVTLVRFNKAARHRPGQLRTATQPNRILLAPADPLREARTPGHTAAQHQSVSAVTGITYPSAPPLAITLASALPQQVVDEKVWASLEANPLASLLAATHYTTVEPVPAGSPRRIEVAPLGPHDLAAARASGASGFATVALAPAVELHPVREPAPSSGVRAPRRIGKLLATAPARVIPAGPSWLGEHGLTRESTTLHVPPPPGAAGKVRPNWSSHWAASAPVPAVPVRARQRDAALLGSAAGVALAPPSPAGAAAAPDKKNMTAVAVPVAEMRPHTRLRRLGDSLLLAGAVPCELRPDAAAGEQTIHRPSSLQTVLRLRLPRHAPKRISRYGTADCVPLPAPPPARFTAPAPRPDSLTPAPDAALPGPAPHLRLLSLKRLPPRLYRVPGAQPMARPSQQKPLLQPFGEWGSKPAIRSSGLIADDGRPRKSLKSTQQFSRELYERFTTGGVQELWRKALLLPSDLKWITMVVPLIIGIWVLARPSTAEPVASQPVAVIEQPAGSPAEPPAKPVEIAAVRTAAAPAAEAPAPPAPAKPKTAKPAPIGEPSAWDAFTARIASRASVNLNEDFRNGLSAWDGRGEWARSWSYDRAGTVRPGHMAIFQPSVGLKDYVFEMKASIERHSIQWMVRAANLQNYHFARLNVSPGAPLTRLELERWTVINGRVGKVTRLPLPHGGANQTLYAIRVEVRGDSITTYLQDQVIDTFNDPRLQDGGVGLVGGADDRPRVYGIRVTHQNDFFGKLCSFLAPQPIHTQGSD